VAAFLHRCALLATLRFWGNSTVEARELSGIAVPTPYRPVKPGKLIRAGVTRPRVVLCLSHVDEHIPAAGANPDGGILQQVSNGPHNPVMFLSCVGFALPAFVHLYMHHCVADYIAAFGLLCVTCTSTLCDAFCIHYGVYDDNNNSNNNHNKGETQELESMSSSFGKDSVASAASCYEKAALAGGTTPTAIETLINEKGDPREIIAPDKWNNFTRLLDRAVCVAITAPSLLWWMWCVRPSITGNIKYFGLFGIAFACNLIGQRYPQANPCGFTMEHGKRVVDSDYNTFERFHFTWHFLLITIFTMSALNRPSPSS